MGNILLVNQFASAQYLSDKFKANGIKATALYTLNFATLPAYFKPSPELFDQQISIVTDDYKAAIENLKYQKYDYVINGLESSLEMSDNLAKFYTPEFANDPQTAHLRNNKYYMHEALAKNKINHIRQILYKFEKNNCISDIEIQYPCFVKPLAGAGSLGAKKLNDNESLNQYFQHNASLDCNNIWTSANNKNLFLISEYVEGEEFLVDTFSIKGKHYVSSIQKYHRNYVNNVPICNYFEIVTCKLTQQQITTYIEQVLNTTGFYNGFAHTEIFITRDGNIKLIEINPRCSGARGTINTLARLAGLPDQVDLLINHVNLANYKVEVSKEKEFIRCLVLYNFGGFPLYDLHNKLSKWSSIFKLYQNVRDGYCQKTNDSLTLTDSVAFVLLAADSKIQLDTDTYEIIEHDQLGW